MPDTIPKTFHASINLIFSTIPLGGHYYIFFYVWGTQVFKARQFIHPSNKINVRILTQAVWFQTKWCFFLFVLLFFICVL